MCGFNADCPGSQKERAARESSSNCVIASYGCMAPFFQASFRLNKQTNNHTNWMFFPPSKGKGPAAAAGRKCFALEQEVVESSGPPPPSPPWPVLDLAGVWVSVCASVPWHPREHPPKNRATLLMVAVVVPVNPFRVDGLNGRWFIYRPIITHAPPTTTTTTTPRTMVLQICCMLVLSFRQLWRQGHSCANCPFRKHVESFTARTVVDGQRREFRVENHRESFLPPPIRS